MKFDAASLAPSGDTTEIEVYHPTTKEGTGMFISVYGKDSDHYKQMQHAQQNRRFKHLSKGRNTGTLQVTAEEIEAEALDLLVACTKSWRDVSYDNQPLECNAVNVRMLYKAVPVIKEQVDDAVHDRANFMKR